MPSTGICSAIVKHKNILCKAFVYHWLGVYISFAQHLHYNDDDQDEPGTGAGGEPDTPPDYEEVVEVDPDEADALIDEGIGAAA